MAQLRLSLAAALVMGGMLAACSSGAGPQTSPGVPPMSGGAAASLRSHADAASVLKTLDDERTIGSVVDPVTGDVNPYGLDVAKINSGEIDAGDLVVCDFNGPSNIQGTGRSVLALRPIIGAKPRHITDLHDFLGCNALALGPTDFIWAAAFGANDNPILNPNGTLATGLRNFRWHQPFGEAFVPPVNAHAFPAFYVSNAGDGSLVRVAITPSGFTFTTIATGFPVNGGAPGSILGPSGLNYQPNGDVLYVVDGTDNALYAIDHVSDVSQDGIAVHGMSFSGPQAGSAHVIFAGAPLNGPISSAVLYNGNIVLGNTLDPNGKNLMVEISPSGALLDVKNVDTGAAGALFGMVATGTSASTTKLFFNDDNDNTLKLLTP